MSSDEMEIKYNKHFGFLEKDYNFSISRQNFDSFSKFIATTEKCVVAISFPKANISSPYASISPVDPSPECTTEHRLPGNHIDVARLARYYQPDLPEPEWWETDRLTLPIKNLAACLKDHCQRMLRGDFSELPEIQAWLYDRMNKRSAIFMQNYKKIGYQIVEKQGKVGLTHNNIPVLPVNYSSIQVFNLDTNEFTLETYKDDPIVEDVSEINYPIIFADGKSGLISNGSQLIPLNYLRVIKLTWSHYLCQKDDNVYELFERSDWRKPIARFVTNRFLTLSILWDILEKENPIAFKNLQTYLKKVDDKFISTYRFYSGTENIQSYYHFFKIAAVKVILNEDFSISEPVEIERF